MFSYLLYSIFFLQNRISLSILESFILSISLLSQAGHKQVDTVLYPHSVVVLFNFKIAE